MIRQIALLLLIFWSFDNSNAEPPSKRQLFKTFKSSIVQDSKKWIDSSSSPWKICNQDSSFYNADTLLVYHSTSEINNTNCCRYVTWTFYKKTSFIQSEVQTCTEPSSGKVFSINDIFNIEITNQNERTYLKTYQNGILVDTFNVLALKSINKTDDSNKVKLLILSRFYPDLKK